VEPGGLITTAWRVTEGDRDILVIVVRCSAQPFGSQLHGKLDRCDNG
jgi:hypothetical protein